MKQDSTRPHLEEPYSENQVEEVSNHIKRGIDDKLYLLTYMSLKHNCVKVRRFEQPRGRGICNVRYIAHLYCLVVQAGFYSVCWTFVRRVAGSILSRGTVIRMFSHVTCGAQRK